jgi:hypothetical protein
MAEKRKRTVDDVKAVRHDGPKKKQKRGFVVGPDNLPDGAYKRKSIHITGLRITTTVILTPLKPRKSRSR